MNHGQQQAERLRREFQTRYGRSARIFRAPGRVNLIGEHTDYNDGFVLPMAIDRSTFVAAAERADRLIRVYSLTLAEQFEFDPDLPPMPRRGIWPDYVEGVARVLEENGQRLTGADLLIDSEVPTGAGLSSSAALEVSAGLALLSLAGATIDRTALALAGQQAEHKYVGANVGIMDQMAAVHSRAGNAILLDCRTLAITYLPLDQPEMSVVVCDSRVRHKLASSEYNTRRAECEQGVRMLQQFLPSIQALRDVSVDEFRQYEAQLPEVIRRRCRHVITENARTLAAASALWSGRLNEMGRLMIASHQSLRDDYEVSCPELNLLVDTALGVSGVFGSRMTGGGFGGCTVSLVRNDALTAFTETITRAYQPTFGQTPGIYVVSAGEGATELT
ncbi:MAG: galactokinase [Blastocatellia bacterium]